MKRRMSLRKKLIGLCLCLTVIPMGIIGGSSLWQLNSLGRHDSQEAYNGLSNMATENLKAGCTADRDKVANFVRSSENRVRQAAVASTFLGYLEAKGGESALLNQIGEKEANTALHGLLQMIEAQDGMFTKQVSRSLTLAQQSLDGIGKAAVDAQQTQQWEAVNQDTGSTKYVSLPLLKIGPHALNGKVRADRESPVADRLSNLFGTSCRIFQLMNSEGEFLCVASSERTDRETRSVGRFIPRIARGGKQNKMLTEVLAGRTFIGRSRVIDGLETVACAPIQDADKKVVGALCIGLSELKSQEIYDAIVTTKIASTGYPFILDSKGTMIMHPSKKWHGQHIVKDMKVKEFAKVLGNFEAGKTQSISYEFEGRSKFIVYTYYPKWDWIVCASGYWQDLSAEAMGTYMDMVRDELRGVYNASTVEIGKKRLPLYTSMAYLDSDGQEIIKVAGGKFAEKLQDKSREEWFLAAKSAKHGQVINMGVNIDEETERPVMLFCSPIYDGGEFHGAVAFSSDWGLVWEQLKNRVYGKTGYPYIIDERGVLVSHPKYALQDNINIGASKYGQLGTLTRTKMIPGETGADRYVFEGIDKFVAYCPLKVGKRSYTVAATCPIGEVFAVANQIKSEGEKRVQTTAWVIGIAAILLVAAGIILGTWVCNGIAKPISEVVEAIQMGSDSVRCAAAQVSASSQSLAEATTEQASNIEETSSAMEEMAAMATQNADYAATANSVVQQSSESVSDGTGVVGSMSSSMAQIETAFDKVRKIIRSIEEIAFQTRLLSINAALEAAGTGEQGKRFAVVADEVRDLSASAAESARETVRLIETAADCVRTGSETATKLTNSFDEIQQGSRKVASLVSEIQAANSEQARGSEQVGRAMVQLDQLTQGNASTSEECAAAAEELTAQSSSMHDAISRLSQLVTGRDVELREEALKHILPQSQQAPLRVAQPVSPQDIVPATTHSPERTEKEEDVEVAGFQQF